MVPDRFATQVGEVGVPLPVLLSDNPKATFARAAAIFCVAENPWQEPTGASQPPHLGEGSSVAPGVYLAHGTRVGNYSSIAPNCVIGPGTQIGNRVAIGPGTVLGHQPFDFAFDGGKWLSVPSTSPVVIDDDVTIGANCTIQSGASRSTRIHSDVKIDDGVHIGHDSVIGTGSIIAGDTAMAGYVTVGRQCKIGGKVGIAEGVTIADAVWITAMSGVASDIDTPHARYASGWPALPARDWWRLVRWLHRRSATRSIDTNPRAR